MQKLIFHVDVNSALYRLKHLDSKHDLREMVSAVGGDVTMRHGIILAKSIPANKNK